MSSSSRALGIGLTCLVALAGCPPGPSPTADVSEDTAVTDVTDQPGVTLGTHEQWKQQPDDFVELHDQSELPIVLGHQGAWMVVLALRSFETLEGELDIVASIEAAGTSLGVLQLINRPLDRELDGADYLYDIWLIVSDPSLSTYDAFITVEVVDDNGLEITLERTVVLSGGSL